MISVYNNRLLLLNKLRFKPNLSELAIEKGIHKNSLNHNLYYFEEAKIISLLMPSGNSTFVLQKPEKIFLHNTTLLYALAEGEIKIGSVRETFFLSQLKPFHRLNAPKKGDFIVDAQTLFEIGGHKKSQKQLNPLYAIDFLLQAKVPANPRSSSNFYPHHGSDHVCGKNSPAVSSLMAGEY